MCFQPQWCALFEHLATTKSDLKLVCFARFDFKICFTPRPGAFFEHLNFQKCSEPAVVVHILTSKCASRHNGVQFVISRLTKWLRTRRFREPSFWTSGTSQHVKNKEKHGVWRPFYLFARLDLLVSAFLFSDCSHLCFPICPYCRKIDFQTFSVTSILNIPLKQRTFDPPAWSKQSVSKFRKWGFRDCSWHGEGLIYCSKHVHVHILKVHIHEKRCAYI